jgi:hypothetical protein
MAAKKWNHIDWKSVHTSIYDLQYKIFCSPKKDNINLVRYYQRILVNSGPAKLLAVRSVTQDNRGKATAGIYGVSKLTHNQRLQLTKKLLIGGKASNIKRVFIPKAGGKIRPLGMLKKQNFSCAKCDLVFMSTDIIELHHVLDKNGKRTGKIEFIDGFCHDHIHSIKY